MDQESHLYRIEQAWAAERPFRSRWELVRYGPFVRVGAVLWPNLWSMPRMDYRMPFSFLWKESAFFN